VRNELIGVVSFAISILRVVLLDLVPETTQDSPDRSCRKLEEGSNRKYLLMFDLSPLSAEPKEG
jgi:hypothetical protein